MGRVRAFLDAVAQGVERDRALIGGQSQPRQSLGGPAHHNTGQGQPAVYNRPGPHQTAKPPTSNQWPTKQQSVGAYSAGRWGRASYAQFCRRRANRLGCGRSWPVLWGAGRAGQRGRRMGQGVPHAPPSIMVRPGRVADACRPGPAGAATGASAGPGPRRPGPADAPVAAVISMWPAPCFTPARTPVCRYRPRRWTGCLP